RVSKPLDYIAGLTTSNASRQRFDKYFREISQNARRFAGSCTQEDAKHDSTPTLVPSEGSTKGGASLSWRRRYRMKRESSRLILHHSFFIHIRFFLVRVGFDFQFRQARITESAIQGGKV